MKGGREREKLGRENEWKKREWEMWGGSRLVKERGRRREKGSLMLFKQDMFWPV